VPPAIPTTSAYLGGWINPNAVTGASSGSKGEAGSSEVSDLTPFNQSNGKSLAILIVYAHFTKPLPVATLTAISNNGSIPLLDWLCANVTDVTNGQYDSQITAYAQALKSYGKPVFLKWFGEMNISDKTNSKCDAFNNGPGYISAWQPIWNIFHTVGASNVAFVWGPSSMEDAAAYYPGDQYVDWIGVDGYDRKYPGASAFTSEFGAFYNQWSGHNKPMMVAETGALGANQGPYLQEILQSVPTQYPDFKAIVYFDSNASGGDWTLQGPGLTAFQSLSHSSYFSFSDH
jgi:beta-mannanase